MLNYSNEWDYNITSIDQRDILSSDKVASSQSHNGLSTDQSRTGADGKQKKDKEDQKTSAMGQKREKNIALDISFVGDIMVHDPQIVSADTGSGYDFTPWFEYVKKYISKSDLAICNLETTFAGNPYTGYPLFSSPDELALGLKNAGFDVATTTNNHTMDKGIYGVKRTVRILEKSGIQVSGTQRKKEDKDYLVKDVNGVKVGIVAATYETDQVSGNRTLNGNRMDEKASQLVNSFGFQSLSEDMKKYKRNIKDARNDGAEVIIAYLHWGDEYDVEPNKREKRIAKKIAGYGADIILASHPHVLQKKSVITVGEGDDEREVPVFYSMGNFISNQRSENNSSRYVEQGIIAQTKITYDKSEKEIQSIQTGYIPTWVDKYYGPGDLEYAVIPLVDDYENNPMLIKSGHVNNAKQARSDIRKRIGKSEKINIFK